MKARAPSGVAGGTPAFAVNKLCGSGLKSPALAAQSIGREETLVWTGS